MKKLILLAVVSVSFFGCTNTDKARNVLVSNGYTNIEFTGYNPFACSDSDDFADGFTATAPGGHQVSGVVCSGILKGATIRF